MARAPLLTLSDIRLTHGGDPLLDGVDLVVHPGERLALVGRNGSGKSTLMKIMAGLVEPDGGQITGQAGTRVGYMEQDPDLSGFATLGDFAAAGLDPGEGYKVEIVAEGLKFDPGTDVSAASGGERRRAALARLMAEATELMLLDEPTNHLDIDAITWLEETLGATRAAFVLISHDRAFLRALTRATLWVDRGGLRRLDKGFDAFEPWRDKLWAEEDLARHKLDRKIKEEARWAVEGISARRKRNQGRLRALADLRAERAAQIRRAGTADLALDSGVQSGKRVIEAKGIAKRFGDRVVLRPFDLRVMRGDRVAIVGPNGAGKTTLIKMLTGDIAPDAGQVSTGTNLDIAVFDQARAALDGGATLWDSLTTDPDLGVAGRSDQVMVRGSPRHVVGYLKDFLFDEAQARGPVRALSGGEKARLLLARIMARPSNLLVLDEPTNDLDIETLDLLQEVLGGYDGTVLLVSHDRDFIDRVATSLILLEPGGQATVYAGGWSDAMAQRAAAGQGAPSDGDSAGGRDGGRQPGRDTGREKGAAPGPAPATTAPANGDAGAGATAGGLSFTEAHRLKQLPDTIARLEAEIARLSDFLSDPELFTREPAKFAKASEGLAERQAALAAAEEDWLDLAARAEEAG